LLNNAFFSTNQLFTESSLDTLPFQLRNSIKEGWDSLAESAVKNSEEESFKKLIRKQSPEWVLNMLIKLGGSLKHFFTIFPTVKVSIEYLLKVQTDTQFEILIQQFASQSDNTMTLQNLLNCYQSLLKFKLSKP
jgi:hypothetical protein